MDTWQAILAIIAAITGPACGVLVAAIRRLYMDLKEFQARYEAFSIASDKRYEKLLRETIEALGSIEWTTNGDK